MNDFKSSATQQRLIYVLTFLSTVNQGCLMEQRAYIYNKSFIFPPVKSHTHVSFQGNPEI